MAFPSPYEFTGSTNEEHVKNFRRFMSGHTDMWDIFATMSLPEHSLAGQNGRAKYAGLNCDSSETLYQAAITVINFEMNGLRNIEDYIPGAKQAIVFMLADVYRLNKEALTPRNHSGW